MSTSTPEPGPSRRPSAPRGGAWARVGLPLVLVLGAWVLTWNLAATGLWEPWEMDRAALARTLVDPPELAVALGLDRQPTHALIEELATAEGAVARFATRPLRGARGTNAGPRTLREALDHARAHVTAAVVLDGKLLAAATDPDDAWEGAWSRLDEAASYVPNGRVVLLDDSGQPAEAVLRRLSVARLRHAWSELEGDSALPAAPWPPATDAFWDAHLPDMEPVAGLHIVAPDDAEALRGALAEAARATRAVVQFKDNGETLTVPPLRHWITARLYGWFGISEATTRLAGALLGLLTLLLLVVAVARRYGPRVATLSGLVLATTPLFYAQARSAAGEAEVMLALTLSGVGLLEHAHGRRGLGVWLWLLAGTLVGLFGGGLTAVTVQAAIAVACALVVGSRRPADWAPAVALAAAAGLLVAWVLGGPADGELSQFRFTLPMFGEGPTPYARNFDLIVRAVGFGSLPWSPLFVVALAALAWRGASERDAPAIVLVLWFAVPALFVMGLLKEHNQFLWHAAPAAAVAVGLFLDDIRERGLDSPWLAMVVFVMTVILLTDLGRGADPLAAVTAYDPPFGDDTGAPFPTEVAVPRWLLAVTVGLSVPLLLHLVGSSRRVLPLLTALRRPRVLGGLVAGAVVLLPIVWLTRTLGEYGAGLEQDSATRLSEAQRAYASVFIGSADPAVVLAWSSVVVVALVALLRWAVPRVSGLEIPDETPELLAKAGPWLHRAGAVSLVLTGVILLASTMAPDGYWSETLLHPELVGVLGLAALAAFVAIRAGGGVLDAGLAAAAVLGLWLATRLSRDAFFVPLPAALVLAVAVVAYGLLLAGQLWRSWPRLLLLGGVTVGAGLAAIALPLMERWDRMAPLLHGAAVDGLTEHLLLRSRVSWLLYLGLAGLLVNRFAPGGLRDLGHALHRFAGRGWLAVASLGLAGLVFTGFTVTGFFPEIAEHVSQKHVVETYLAAEGRTADDLGDQIFKHGRFAASGQADSNFYTAGIPEIRDRKAALAVLLGREDRATALETVAGTEGRLLRGWDPANDTDGDGRRDHEPIEGRATGGKTAVLIDESQSWAPDEHVGRVLVDSARKVFTVASNDATTLNLNERSRVSWAPSKPEKNVYILDHADAANHRATAMEPTRRWFLLPADGLSELNYAHRKMADGGHIPIVDGRSSRVLLASSWLGDGTPQQNRIANHTIDRAAFDALDDPRLRRAWTDFDGKIRVLGYHMDDEAVSRGGPLRITLYFEMLQEVRTSYKVFMHLDRPGTTNRIHGDHWPLNLAVKADEEGKKKCHGCYKTTHWLKGDVVLDVFETEVPAGTPSGTHEIWMGLFNPDDDKRLKVKSFDRGRVRHDGDNRVRLGTFRVR